MREIVFDTETTGLDAGQDRIIEIGGIELFKRYPTGRVFHRYVNPQGRMVHADARAVHGISMADLADKPTFDAIADEFLAFIDGAKLVAHNAGFDIAFVNAELGRVGHPPVTSDRVIDTLTIARRKHPMGPNSLDALCRRYGIDNSHRTKHGALLDSELLAEVYLELIGGKQGALGLEIVQEPRPGSESIIVAVTIGARPRPLAPRLSEAELVAHAAMVAELGDAAVWKRLN
jgi:DNA polymerase III subunit epsilon